MPRHLTSFTKLTFQFLKRKAKCLVMSPSYFTMRASTSNSVSDEWIPPNRPRDNGCDTIDRPLTEWESTRQKNLDKRMATGMVRPEDGRRLQHSMLEIEVKERTYLSRHEISKLLTILGAQNVVLLPDNREQPRLDGAIGIILATSPSPTQMRKLVDSLVYQMRQRNLDRMGVLGAQLGPEGDQHSGWMVVDCGNYVVHVQDEETREQVGLKQLWSGEDGLYRLDLSNEEEVDEYIENNPIPDEFNVNDVAMEDIFKQLQKSQLTRNLSNSNGSRKRQGRVKKRRK